jgi:hypothetical protein
MTSVHTRYSGIDVSFDSGYQQKDVLSRKANSATGYTGNADQVVLNCSPTLAPYDPDSAL